MIDDDPMVRRALAAWMETRGIDARLVADGTQAFAVVAQGFEPEVVLCDQRLRSGESGFELLEALLARLPGARGAMMSGELEASEL
ncbi:response regulator, partial [Escherichia coli]|nr:response regulator [Escherichia coli]